MSLLSLDMIRSFLVPKLVLVIVTVGFKYFLTCLKMHISMEKGILVAVKDESGARRLPLTAC